MSTPPDRGRTADTPGAVPARGWWDVLKRTFKQSSEDNLDLIAAGVAFYGFLALVPLLGALVLTYGLVVDPAELARHVTELAAVMPADAARLVNEQLSNLVTTSADKKGLGLLAALALALFGATKGAGAIVTALNVAYEETDKRGFIGGYLTNAAITLGAVLVAIALIVATAATHALETVAGGLHPAAIVVITVLGWLISGAIAASAIAALYRYGPSRANARWRWLSPGALVATLGLLAASAGFGWYAASFGNYNATYGSLGAVVVLLLWLYISAYVLILGAELNAELEHQTAVDTTTGPEQPLGERKAVMADTVAA